MEQTYKNKHGARVVAVLGNNQAIIGDLERSDNSTVVITNPAALVTQQNGNLSLVELGFSPQKVRAVFSLLIFVEDMRDGLQLERALDDFRAHTSARRAGIVLPLKQ